MGSSWAASVYLGDKSILRMRTRVSEGHITSCHRGGRLELCAGPAPLLSLGCHSEKSSSPATREILFAGWWLPPPGRVTQVQGQCPGRAGLGGGPGRGRRAAPSSRQLHGQQSSPPSDSVSGRAEPSQSLRTWARVRTWTLAV